MKSSEFRKRYAALHDVTEVTVNGHVIGKWVPSVGRTWTSDIDGANATEAPVYADEPSSLSPDDIARVKAALPNVERFNSTPFRGPIPKKR